VTAKNSTGRSKKRFLLYTMNNYLYDLKLKVENRWSQRSEK
jgi:hypothetical protein